MNTPVLKTKRLILRKFTKHPFCLSTYEHEKINDSFDTLKTKILKICRKTGGRLQTRVNYLCIYCMDS